MAEAISKRDSTDEKDENFDTVTPTDSEDGTVPNGKPSDSSTNAEESFVPTRYPSEPNAEGSIFPDGKRSTNLNTEDSSVPTSKPSNTNPNEEYNNESVMTAKMSDLSINPSIPSEDLALSAGGASEFPDKQVDQETQESSLKTSLSSLGLTQDQVEFLIEQGEKCTENSLVLSKKLKISTDIARRAIDILKSSKKVEELILIPADVKKIQECLKENPDIDCHRDIAFFCEIDEELVSKYFEMLPLNEKQQKFIQERYNKDISVSDISNLLKISTKKVQDYIEKTFITFSGEEGRFVFDIINRHCGQMSTHTLREKIRNKNLKLQDQLYCILNRKNDSENDILRAYFSKDKESEDILNFDLNLTIDDILTIKQNSNDSAEQLSVKLNKIESVINSYIFSYSVHPVELNYFRELQEKQIYALADAYGTNTFSFDSYRTIITIPFDEIIKRVQTIPNSKESKSMLIELLPLVFYYLKCSLPFEDIARIIANVNEITLTTHDVFHLVFQLSDPVLKGLCIEHYSFSNPVPLYYPKLKHPLSKFSKVEFEICKELWYCLEQYNGLISFGLGRASWNTVGKSTLLDLIFETDFVKGNPQSSAFHSGSIDIQITKNLLGEANISQLESTKWAYIDCHSYSDLSVIQALCSHLDVAIIHVCYNDYVNNKQEINKELSQIEKVKHIYIFLRDYEGDSMQVSKISESLTEILIPNLTRKDIKYHSVIKSSKEIGYQILHLKIEQPTLIQSQLIEDIMLDLDCDLVKVIQTEKQLIKNTTDYFLNTNKIDFSFLSYYPTFVDYMSSYYKASYETDQDRIDELNAVCEELSGRLSNISRGNIVLSFNKILEQGNSTLILWKLSRELLHLSKASTISKQEETSTNTVKEQKNDKYTLEILWRESLLSQRYGQNTEDRDKDKYKQLLAANFSKHVGNGEAFELIDGDNLRFFNKDIDSLLSNFYFKQEESLKKINRGKTTKVKPAPIVVSIFGPQGSGKSTLLNYCFGCKFLTSAGRCTRGIYASLSKLDRPVNLSQSLLILDTEGLDAIERDNIKDTSMIHFDRTMVLFCLSVSQVVIINVKGDIGSEMQNLLQICAYSLNRLKVNKTKAPKIFFVLNQQADPDPNKHLDTINLLMERLNSEFGLMDTEGVKISDLIQVSRENLFILPTAFNVQQMNGTSAKLFHSDVMKLSPTVAFSDKCTNLRLAIIDQLDHMPLDDRAPFQNMSEWVEMAGVSWDTIIKYQDIVQYNNLEELKCNNKLDIIIAELMEKYFNKHQEELMTLTKSLCEEIKKINSHVPADNLLTEYMSKFDEVFEEYKILGIKEFQARCESDRFLKKMGHICDERETNIKRLIYSERKRYKDQIILQIKSVLIEIKFVENKKKFNDAFAQDVNRYLQYSVAEQEQAFLKIWDESFGSEDDENEYREREENFSELYSIFKIEFNKMEQNQKIKDFFRSRAYDLDAIIDSIKSTIREKFVKSSSVQSEQFIYSLNNFHTPIKDMVPYNGSPNYSYVCQESLSTIEKPRYWGNLNINLIKWIPRECQSLLQYCSGLFSHPDIIWNQNKSTQTRLLISSLRDPNNSEASTWDKFINDISTDILQLLDSNIHVSPVVVKQITHALCYRIKLMNYEIGFISAGLSESAERTLSTFAFAYAFKFLWESKVQIRQKNTEKKNSEKDELLQIFNLKIESQKMALGEWNRESMTEKDKTISKNYCSDYVESIKRSLKTSLQHSLRNFLGAICSEESLSHEVILSLAYDRVNNELLNPGNEITDTKNIVVQYICDRNAVLKQIFVEKWEKVEAKLHPEISKNMELCFVGHIRGLKSILCDLLQDLEKINKHMSKGFHSDNFFEIVNNKNYCYIETKDVPFKAATMYLKQYLDPKLTPNKFTEFLSNIFQVGGNKIKMCEAYSLPPKQSKTTLDDVTFEKLVKTGMFNDTELIFNIYDYVKHFLFVLEDYRIELTQDEFQEMIAPLKDEFERNMIGCPSQCPSCGKFCERKIHTNEGKCQIKTGHQISSMGGKVWNAGKDNTAVLFMCDDYKDYTRVTSPCGEMEWGEFKDKCGSEWNWDLPIEEKYKSKQESNPEFMKNVWNKFGRAILQYQYKSIRKNIKFVPYSTYEEVIQPLLPINYFICFVIDGTGSMGRDISRVRVSVGQLISNFISRGNSAQFRVVIYRDHCDDNVIETFPHGKEFTTKHNTVENFLRDVEADGGGDFPEAVLDGLATAVTQSDWGCVARVRNKIIHIFDAPPHGDFPNYTSHSRYSDKVNCCCCNQGTKCKFTWDGDVWNMFKRLNIEYHAINTSPRSYDTDSYGKFLKTIMAYVSTSFNTDLIFSNYESKMKQELGSLCDNFQVVGKEVVNDAILKIFVDHKKK